MSATSVVSSSVPSGEVKTNYSHSSSQNTYDPSKIRLFDDEGKANANGVAGAFFACGNSVFTAG